MLLLFLKVVVVTTLPEFYFMQKKIQSTREKTLPLQNPNSTAPSPLGIILTGFNAETKLRSFLGNNDWKISDKFVHIPPRHSQDLSSDETRHVLSGIAVVYSQRIATPSRFIRKFFE